MNDALSPMLLNGSDGAWRIESGGVDLFSVALERGAAAGAKDHVCRLGPGQFMLGLGSATRDAPTGLQAVFLPDTRLSTVHPVSRRSPADAQDVSLVAMVDQWLIRITSAMLERPPRHFVHAQPGGPFDLGAEEAVYAKEGVVWLDASQGGLHWMPARQPIAAGLFPLTPTTWAASADGTRLSCRHTHEAIASDRLEVGLAAFHSAFIGVLGTQREQREQQALRRLSARHESQGREFGRALAGLAQVLKSGDGNVDTLPAATSDPLLAACQLVMKAAGVRAELKSDGQAASVAESIRLFAAQARAAYRTVTLSGETWWRDDVGPLLAFRREDGMPVALLPAHAKGYWLIDALSGARSRLDADAAASLGATAFSFFRPLPERPMNLIDLLRFALAGTGRDAARLLAVGALGGALAVFTPFAAGTLIDSVIPAANAGQLAQLVGLLVAATLGVSAFELTRAIALVRIDARAGNATQAAIVHRLLHLPAPFFRNYGAGDLTLRAFGIASILQLLSSTTQAALLGWTFGLFSFGYLFFVSWQLALLSAALVGVALAFSLVTLLMQLKIERKSAQVQGDVASRVFQILTGIAKLRANGAEHRAFSLWARDFSRQKELNKQARSIGNVAAVFDSSYVLVASLVLFGAVAWLQPGMNPGGFVAFNTAFAQFFAATVALSGALTASLGAVPLYERAKPLLQSLPEVGAAKAASRSLSGAIDISHASFRYEVDGPLILDDVNVSIAPGEFVAFVGESGSGKSTLLRLLLGFEQPQSGAVYYDGQDLSRLDVGTVRRQLGVVLQHGKLLPGDIFTNIVGSSALTLADAWEAARMAGLEEDIKAMPMGMHTVLAEGAGTISGGQKQRIMVARAIVRKPRILFFDEATSALDNQTQATVASSIEQLNATRIVIAHRLSTVLKADRICVLEAGRIVESGSPAQLMARGGRFSELASRQVV